MGSKVVLTQRSGIELSYYPIMISMTPILAAK